jgi:hypothetical protein
LKAASSVGDPHPKDSDASPELGPDPDCHFDSDPILAFHSDVDPHFFFPTFYFDADPELAPHQRDANRQPGPLRI